MDDTMDKKNSIIEKVTHAIESFEPSELSEKLIKIENRLFEFANFVEARITLFYMKRGFEVDTTGIINRCVSNNKIIVLPSINPESNKIKLLKLDDPEKEFQDGPGGMKEPNPQICKAVPISNIEIAIIPGIIFDEKGSRAGFSSGYYDRLIANLPVTTRKVAIAFEEQIVSLVPADIKQKNVDIIITDERIIYKI